MAEVIIHNCETDEIIEREMTKEEIAQAKKDEQSRLDLIQAKIDKENARKAILDKIGLTADEARTLGL
jgi:hypothetical protein